MAFDVQNIYGTPQIPRKKPCLRPRRMTLIDLRNVRVDEDDEPYRKSSTATIRSEGTGTQYYTKHGGIQPMYDSSDTGSLDSFRSTSSQMKIRRVSSSFDGSIRFPKLQECAHFHYDIVELPDLQLCLCDEEQENYHHNGDEVMERTFLVKVTCCQKSWNVKRTFKNFRMLDRQLHKCIFDRRFSRLQDLQKEEMARSTYQEMETVLQSYMGKLSELAGSNINCGSILNWFELDNRGNRLLVVDDSGINTPAIAAAHAIKRYTAKAVDEISLEVGDIVSVIDMPSPEDTLWWRGKRGFEVGFFPSECVEVIGDKVPVSMQTHVPLSSNIVRKHGKFLSFLRMFFSTRPARVQLKQSGIVKERVFGCDLGEHLLNSGHDVPLVLKSCSEIIEEYGIVDGIYRLSGITSNIQKIRHAFDEDRVPDLTEEIYLQDIHSISSLLKMYFRELPNPLLTYQLYDKFADAVRDEDNKLWKIHDVVQQLPPPHYRTTEYLMRHLAKVAAFGSETGMHSKNLAIVWAPNLLRSKELECGGGAAALQGVGIQAVVTECLILYADLIFSDKMPSYSSPEMRQSRKKPRPKSLAISTPTKLITLEEARERALSASLRPPSQKFIDVGGGPKNLPDRYHTVIDLPGYRKKVPLKDVGNLKGKKSPSGWRSLFSKSNRHGSVKHKTLKGSAPDSLSQLDRRAITEEDVHNWKRRRLRGAKSAESLINLPASNRESNRMSRLIDDNLFMKMYTDEKPTRHKRSLSSESPRNFHHSESSAMYPSFIMAGSREVAIDVDTSMPLDDSSNSNSDSPEVIAKKKQSFVRNETKRRVVTQRKVPSAPSTPRQDTEHREKSRSPKISKKKSSLLTNDSKEIKILKQDIVPNATDSEKFILRMEDTNLLKPKDPNSKGASPNKDEGSRVKGIKTPPSGRRDSKTSPRVRRKSGDTKTAGEKTSNKLNDSDICKKKKVMTIDLPESPGAKRKNWIGSSGSTPATTPDDPQYYFSRNHDYAEILSDSEESQKKLSNHALCVHDNVDASRLSDSYDNLDPMFFLPHSPPTENVTCDYQSEECQNESQYAKILRKTSASFDEARSKENAATNQISKCLSVPSDIQKSLENMNSGSQTDMLSSVTISELSTSVESFNLPDDTKISQQKRKSASLDSLTEKDSPLTRTLVEINAQIDRAFKSEVDKATQMKQEENEEISSQLSNTQCVIPSQMELSGVYDNFEDMSSCSFSETLLSSNETLEIPSVQDSVSETHFVQDSPKSDLETVETLRLIRAPLKPGQQTTTIVKQNSSDSTISMETIFSSNPLSDTHSVQGSVSKSHSVQDSHSQNFYSENSQIDMIGGMERTTFEKSQYSMYSSHQSSNHGQCGLSSQISRTEQRTSRLMKQNSIEKIVKQDSFSKEDHVCNTPGLLTSACDSTHSPSLDSHLSNHQSSPSSKNQQAAAFAHQSTSSFTPTQNTSSYVTRSDHASSMQVPADHIISPSRSEFSPPQFRDDICSTQSRTESGPVQSHSESGSVQGIGDLTQRTMCYSPTQMKVNKNQTHSDMYSSGNQTQTAKVISPLASPVVVQRRPKSIHRTSMGPISPQSQGQAWPSPSSSPGQTRSNSSQGSSPFMSPTSPQQSRGFDIRRTHSRHGKVTFDLSEEDLHFLSQQGKIQDALLKSDSQMSSTSSSVTSSPESKNRKGKVDPACPVPPAKRDFPHLLLSSTKSCDSNATSSPRSPRQNPRWEDLAGLNQDFRAMAGLNKSNVGQRQEGTCIASKVHQNMDTLQRGRSASDSCVSKMTEETPFERKLQDISNFNEVWRHQLTPTGETCRIGEQIESRCQTGCHVTGSHLLNNTKVTQTNNKEEHVTSQRHQLKKSSTIAAMETAMEFYPSEQSSHGIGSHHSHRERTPECRMEEQTVVIEKPMIKKCLTESDIPHIKHCNIVTQDSLSTTSSSGASDLHIPVSDLQTLASDPQSKELHVQDYQSVSSRMTGKDDSQFKHKTPNMEARAKNLPESGRDVNPKPCKMQKIDSKEIKLNMPMLPPLELSGFPQFENSGLIPTTGASLNNKHEDDHDDPKSKRDSDVTIYENDPLPKDLDISDFGTVENPSPVASKVQGCPTLDTRPTMEEFDLNESCFGIPSHQNLSNELKEKAQEKLKGPGQNQVNYGNLQGIENMPVHRDRALINEYDDTVLLQGPASNTISLQGPVSNTVQGPASRVVHVGIGFQSFNDNIRGLEATLQYTTDQQMEIGATVQYNTDYVDLHLDEDIQMLSQGPMVTAAPFVIDQMEPHNTVSQTVDTTEEAAQNEINADRELSMTLQNSLNPALKGWEYDDVSCSTQFPDQRNPSDFKLVSPAEACLEKVDLSNPDLPELAPPTREFLEVNRPRMIRSRVKPKSIVRPLQTFKVANRETFSDKGENEVLVEHRASFKKKAPVPLPKTKSHSIKPREDFTDQSDINDDVFTDDVKSTITQSRFLRRPCASTTAFVFPNVLPCDSSNRSSLDESVLQLASNRLDDFASDDSDTGKREDIRFTRAHKSAKLQSLKELFEKSCNERSSSEKRKSGSHERGIVLADLIQENQLESSTRVTETLPDLSYQESQLQYDKGSVGYGKSQNTSILDGTNFMQEDLNSPRTRRSISTDVGYEFRSGRADIARGIPMTTAKPPKHRSTSRTRTPSESSTSELDTKSTKSVRQDGSPRSQREGPAARHDGSPRSLREGSSSSKSSPKSQRDYSPLGYMSGDDSPRMRNKTDGSPRGLRHVSFQRTESYEQTSPQSPRSWSTTRSVTIDTMEHPIADRMTQSLQGNLRSRRAVSMETSQQRAADLMSQSLTFSNSNSTERQSEHKGSIKELMNYFESKTEGQMLDGDVATTPSMSSAVQRTRQRVHSVSPTVGLRQMSRSSESLGVINIRHSLELPGSLDAVDAIIRPQPVRIGPKPFYNPQQT